MSLLHPGHVLYEGDNHNLIVLKDTSSWINADGNDQFSYKSSRHGWHNNNSHFMISTDGFKSGANVATKDYNKKSAGQKWYIEYCDEHDHDQK